MYTSPQLIFANVQNQQRREDVDEYLGIYNELNNPILLFMNIQDLVNDRAYVYFFAYSMGKKKLVFWGVYRKQYQDFIIDNSCRYNTRELSGMLKEWETIGYSYISNSIKDRFTSRIYEYVNDKSLTPHISNYDDYRILKYILSYYNDRIDEDTLYTLINPHKLEDFIQSFMREYGVIFIEDNMDTFYNYLDELSEEIKLYESKLNRNDINATLKRLPEEVVLEIFEINAKFYKFISTTDIIKDYIYSSIPQCPERATCLKNLQDELCGLYIYGTDELLYGEDARRFL